MVFKASMIDYPGGFISFIYIYIYVQCSSMQGLYARLNGGFICLLSICIVLDLAVGVAVYKASMLD